MNGKTIIVVLLVIVVLVWFFSFRSCEGYAHWSDTMTNAELCGCDSKYGQYLSHCGCNTLAADTQSMCTEEFPANNELGADAIAVRAGRRGKWQVPATIYGHEMRHRYEKDPVRHQRDSGQRCHSFCASVLDACMQNGGDPLECQTRARDECMGSCQSSLAASPMTATLEGPQPSNNPGKFCSVAAEIACAPGDSKCLNDVGEVCMRWFA